MALEIRNVTNDKKGLKQFIKLPWKLYKDDPHWAPELLMQVNARLDKKKFPFYEIGDAEFFLALRDGEPVGRIAAIENRWHNEYRKENIGFWGFFECENNQETANALFDAARAWNRARGYDNMRGPMSHDIQDEIGIVIEGFDQMRYFLMPHNPRYYPELCDAAGMTKEKDLLAFSLDINQPIPEKVERIAEIAQQRLEKTGITVRPMNMKTKEATLADIEKILAVNNEAWTNEWGYVPATRRQFAELGESIQLVVPKELALIVEGPADPESGERKVIGMAVAMYDVSEATYAVRKWPFALQGIAQLLNLAGRIFLKPRPKFTRGRIFFLGVLEEYRGRGIDSLLYVLPFKAGKKLGVQHAELSWEREDAAVVGPIVKMGANVYKKMRIYNAKTS